MGKSRSRVDPLDLAVIDQAQENLRRALGGLHIGAFNVDIPELAGLNKSLADFSSNFSTLTNQVSNSLEPFHSIKQLGIPSGVWDQVTSPLGDVLSRSA